jgi:hypothetical protein
LKAHFIDFCRWISIKENTFRCAVLLLLATRSWFLF